MGLPKELKRKKEVWGYWLNSATDWAICEYQEDLDGGPYKRFGDAKKALKTALYDKARIFREQAKIAGELQQWEARLNDPI